MPLTKMFLLYSYENIDNLKHPNIIPLKLNQTEYFESEAYRMLNEEDLPDCDNIAFISPKALQINIRNQSLDNYLNSLNKNMNTIEPLHLEGLQYNFNSSVYFHGENFLKIWTILCYKIGYTNYEFNNVKMFYRNSWIAKRETVIGFLKFIKPLFKIMEEPQLKILGFTDAKYQGASLSKEVLLSKFGVPHYPLHPFVFERLICLYKYMIERAKL
jgi:hypothetical protein